MLGDDFERRIRLGSISRRIVPDILIDAQQIGIYARMYISLPLMQQVSMHTLYDTIRASPAIAKPRRQRPLPAQFQTAVVEGGPMRTYDGNHASEAQNNSMYTSYSL